MKYSTNSEKILSSLDEVKQAKVPDYFYTRLTGRLQREFSESQVFFLIRPVQLILGFVLLLVFNFFVMAMHLQKARRSSAGTEELAVSSTLEDDLNVPALLYYEK